ncbi:MULTISPECIES: SRPBCC family protein [Pseudomonas]|uniref:SRPBCC family protein n=1 Tax=Pseudomonas tritici TaxID=2745518 RepID=A0A8I0D1R9_9PSED|nr:MULTISPECIES: SRPBCC family protein [Pseudomonas]MBP2874734.1 SRPBCC family protein [Pseudomonas sp. SWRI144]MBW8130789.1 SRPBCC family protein [Pseudomonas sp. LAP_36]MBW8140056.1 SRPBCC family protein [Pseudomonas sp. PAMC 26818]QXH84209.1 SRPBCC family protein [Pseudomonas tritici]CRL97027.1 Polyketide cyclase / dehydrase and lipid transport [Pseudomonas sp. 24 E 1]
MKPLQPDTLIRNPDGLPIVASVVVDCHASRLWNMVGNFSGFDVFIPDLTHIEMTGTGVGALRTKFFRDGNCVVEQLNSRDEQTMHMTWTTIYNTLGVARLWAAIGVEALGVECSRVTWTIIAQPMDEANAGFEQFVQDFANSALDNVRRLLG